MIAMALYRRRKRQAYRAALVTSPREGVFRDDSVGSDDEMDRQNSDNDKNGTIAFADDNHYTNDSHNDLYAHEFIDTTTTTMAAAPVMEDINLEEPAAVEEEEESPDPLQPLPAASMPTPAKATSLQDDDDEDPEDSLPYFT